MHDVLDWLTAEKAAALVAIIAAAAAYYTGAKKRPEAAASAPGDPNGILKQILQLFEDVVDQAHREKRRELAATREHQDKVEGLMVQIRDEFRLLRGAPASQIQADQTDLARQRAAEGHDLP